MLVFIARLFFIVMIYVLSIYFMRNINTTNQIPIPIYSFFMHGDQNMVLRHTSQIFNSNNIIHNF